MLDKRMDAALRYLLRPIASLLLRNDIDVRSTIDIIKESFVDVAGREFGAGDKLASISKTAEKTGLTRREVKRIRETQVDTISAREFFGPTESDLLSYWNSKPKYLDDNAMPRVLPFGPGEGSFTDLVKDTLGSDSPLMHLDRLRESGSVSVSSDNFVTLTRRDFSINEDLAMLVGEGLGTLAHTMCRNWARDPRSGNCQRVAYSVRVKPEKVEMVRRFARERIVRFAEEVDDYVTEAESETQQAFFTRDGNELVRIGVGVYYFEVEADDAGPESS